MINSQDAGPVKPDATGSEINPTQPVQPVNATEAERFANLKNSEVDEVGVEEVAQEENSVTPEELHGQIRDNLFREGFKRAMEKAREISKELREG